jgi:malonyl-CoA/methylmalonyl-CoA synthetase
MSIFPAFDKASDRIAVAMPDGELSYRGLRDAAAELSGRVALGAGEPAGDGDRPLALWATPERGTVVGLLACLSAGVPLVPLNPKAGQSELEHILADSRPRGLLAPSDVSLPGLETIVWNPAAPELSALPLPDAVSTTNALIVYTSGTTGPPKGVLLSVSAIAANLDALAVAWDWSAADVLVHALPLFHVHGLVLGTLGPLRIGGFVRHLGKFDPQSLAAALAADATMLFAVPTMYNRLADAAEDDQAIGRGTARRTASRVRFGSTAGRPARADRAALPAADRRALRDERDADDRGGPQ